MHERLFDLLDAELARHLPLEVGPFALRLVPVTRWENDGLTVRGALSGEEYLVMASFALSGPGAPPPPEENAVALVEKELFADEARIAAYLEALFTVTRRIFERGVREPAQALRAKRGGRAFTLAHLRQTHRMSAPSEPTVAAFVARLSAADALGDFID